MAYLLEFRVPRARRCVAGDRHAAAVVQRWQRACERLESALAEVAALCTRVPSDDPTLVAARLRVAEARRRRHEAAEQVEALDEDFDA
jgi:hypothetical protein